ncbi:dihydroxyacetone kinase subunit DhaK [Kitasatospora sp. NPDC087314]|uniref:dihydroxyacetone kinase subunit DhaK n=1 Tax=Kitasatospora sp. NPDC087314 TaxID=3364068 RepID=UPI0038064AFF
MAPYLETDQDALVASALAGFARAHPSLVVHDPDLGFVRARDRAPGRRVGLLSGGGSGHEPMHVGFVGRGMLDAACPGRIFASPHNRQIFEASRAVAGEDGVLHIVKNYTGDRINFGIAAERLHRQGIPCARVLVDDDLASESESVAAGRRGTAATVLVQKILGAAADRGLGLTELASLGSALAGRCRSIAVAGAAHTSPATGRPAFEVLEHLVEFGVGIHGERAELSLEREPLGVLVGRMALRLLESLRPARAPLVALVNGLGATTSLELYAVLNELAAVLDTGGRRLARALVGDYVTALDMRGFSITLLAADEQTLALLDAPAYTAAWPAAESAPAPGHQEVRR